MMVDTEVYQTSCMVDQRARWVEIHFDLNRRIGVTRETTISGSVIYRWCNEIHRVAVEVDLNDYQVALYDLTTNKRVAFNVYQYTNH